MQLTDAHIALLNSILAEWNRAESDIKRAEQVNNNVVIPSIKELRYAGRRIVDMLVKIGSGAPDDEIHKLLADATFDCHRARHDAIDAATSKIAIDLEIMASKLGYEVILPAYPNFAQLVRDLQLVRAKIAVSREDRENREAIYSVIEAVDFPNLVTSYNDMRSSEHIMIQMAKRRRSSEAIGIGGAILGAIGITLAIVFWRFPITP